MEQIERIQEMERCLDVAEKAIRELSEALSAYEDFQPQYQKLSDYYSGGQWIQDYEDDEAGKLPQNLKRGVLSEDVVYDLITENRELLVRMMRLVTAAIESDIL